MNGGQGLIFFSGSWEKFPGRNQGTGCPALQLRASSEQVTNHQLRTTPNILEHGRKRLLSILGKPPSKQIASGDESHKGTEIPWTVVCYQSELSLEPHSRISRSVPRGNGGRRKPSVASPELRDQSPVVILRGRPSIQEPVSKRATSATRPA